MLRAIRQADYSTTARRRAQTVCYNAPRMSTSADMGMGAEDQVAPEERYVEPPRLTVADGFRFGCGLLLAVVAFSFILAIVVTTLVLLAMLLRVPLPPFGTL